MMDSFSRQELQKLMASEGGPHLSIYLPSPERPNDANQDAIRLAGTIRSSQETLVEYWMPKPQSQAFLKPLNELCGDTGFLADRSTAVAIFRSTDLFQTFRIEPPQEEKVVIGRTFHVRPVISKALDTSFYLLALSRNRDTLYSLVGDSISELELPGLPKSYAQETADVTVDRGAQLHASGRGTVGKQAAVFHGQGGQSETKKTELQEHLRRVDGAVQARLQQDIRPIILAGVDELTSMYREVSDSPLLCETSISGNVDRQPPDVLREKAAVVIAEERDRQLEVMAGRIREQRRQQVATDPEQVLCAAFEGRVDTLFFDQGAELYGSFFPDTKTMKEIRQAPTGDPADPSHDLIEMAVAQTLHHRGNVYPVEQAKMPVDAKIAAALRY